MHKYKSHYWPQLVLYAIAEPAPTAPAVLYTTAPVFVGNEGQGTSCAREYPSLIHESTRSKDDLETVKSCDSEAVDYALGVLRRANEWFPGGCIPVNLLPPNLCKLPSGFQPIHPEPFTNEKECRNGPTIFIPSSYIKQKEPRHSFFGATWIIYLTDEGLSAVANTTIHCGDGLLLEINNVLGRPVTCPMYYFTRLQAWLILKHLHILQTTLWYHRLVKGGCP
jgi:hypothetical protein